MPRTKMSDEERKAKRRATSKKWSQKILHCDECNKNIKNGSWSAHFKTKLHKGNLRKYLSRR